MIDAAQLGQEKTYLAAREIQSVAVIGMGSVGASWAALFLAHGMRVMAHDSSSDAERRAQAFITDAWPALIKLGISRVNTPPFDRLRFVKTATEAALAADLVQENVPENPALKAVVLAELDAAATPDKIIISSTGGIPPSQLQAHCTHPERFVVIHPFNPTHLIPLVEIVGGRYTSAEVVNWAMAFARHLGKQPIQLQAEASGHMTNRLQFALLREAIYCLLEGIASARDIDAAVRYGLAPRWALMGSIQTLHLAGGPGGMQGILNHAGKAIEEWWTPRGQPTFTPEVITKLVAASEEISAGHPVAAWTAWRDEHLVEVLKLQSSSQLREPQRISTKDE